MPLSVWRIGFSGALTLPALGYGSTLGDGRWHIGCAGPLQLVYCGASRALCQLERRVHCNGAMPKNMVLLRLEIPDTATLLDAELPLNWREDQAATQAIGMRWLVAGASLGLWVPSFVEPAERNLLLNPAHPDYAQIALVVEKNPFVFDPRLF
ncbi:MAG: RES family NAD+ phosphorylase [Rhodoferax sp.]|uniref:RES family NAD+ phosphorylase n=1 Tax=Rhodoferax sp. TaxID=50421 RepID=UPI003267F330